MKNILLSVSLVVLALTGLSLWQNDTIHLEIGDCDPSKVSLPEDAPVALAAIYNYDCAAEFTQNDDELASLLDYPSLLFRTMRQTDALERLQGAAASGEMSYFMRDPQLESVLSQLNENALLDYLRAVKRSPEAFAKAKDLEMVLSAYPIWNSPSAKDAFLAACDETICGSGQFECSQTIPLSLKRSVARGDMELREVYGMCPPSLSWLLALRANGFMDASCSGQIQISAILNDLQGIDDPCFSVEPAPSESSSWSPGRSIAYLRTMQGRLEEITTEDLKVIGRDFPEISSYLLDRKS
ncbi:hypothetical protein [Celeribacter halophilus]|uniref:hypothetical protein n=1 Tax=Celeribacter halophilus TaxID=576117 RepID=UPI003A936735